MTEAERTERDVRALRYHINDEPHLVISAVGEWAQIAYRIKQGQRRSFWLWCQAVKMFAKAAWGRLS